MRIGRGALSGTLLALAGITACGPSAAEVQSATERRDRLVQASGAREEAYRRGLVAAAGAEALPEAACPAAVLERDASTGAIQNYGEHFVRELPPASSIAGRALGRHDVAGWDFAPLSGDGLAYKVNQLAILERSVLGARYEVALVVDEVTWPVVQGSTYSAGRLRGRALVWDFEAARVACAAAIAVDTPEEVRASVGSEQFSASWALEDAARRAVFSRLGLAEIPAGQERTMISGIGESLQARDPAAPRDTR